MPKMVNVMLGDKAEQELSRISLSIQTKLFRKELFTFPTTLRKVQWPSLKIVSSLYTSMNLTTATMHN